MPKVIGGLAAFAALAGGILARVDPVTCVLRAALVFVLGLVATQIWYVFFTVRVRHVSAEGREGSGAASRNP